MSIQHCANCRSEFTITSDDTTFYSSMNVPAPTWCPQCRLIRRMSFYNMRSLYNDICDLCGKAILSGYAPDKPNPVYCNQCWWSDKWDATEYARDYDFSRPFFEQFSELFRSVPMMAVNCDTPTMENSDYCMNAGHLKNCYLAFHADLSEEIYYSDHVITSKDCFDCEMLEGSELCFQSVNLLNCYQAMYSVDCKNSRDIYFSRNLTGCSDCFGCVNLRNAKYCWFNEQLAEEEYKKRLASVSLDTQSAINRYSEQAHALWQEHPVKFMHGFNNEDVSGDYIENAKNVHQSFQTMNAENCKYTMLAIMKPIKDAYDYLSWGNNAERIYECVAVGENVYNMKFAHHCWPDCRDIEYSIYAINSNSLFGSVGIRKKQYCILNKQYSPEEYTQLVERIKQHMNDMPYADTMGREYRYGEFYPSEISLFSYNETLAQEFFPLTQSQAQAAGYTWYSAPANPPSANTNIVQCVHNGNCTHQCKRVFKLLPQELVFYEKMGLAHPELCPNCRHHERLQHRNPPQLWKRECMCKIPSHQHAAKCLAVFETSYAPSRPDRVFCEACYTLAVY